MKGLAISILAWQRPDYLKRCLDALASCKGINDTPIFVFLDGGSEARQEDNLLVIKSFPTLKRSLYPIISPINLGCEGSAMASFERCFKEEEINSLFLLEEDFIVGEYYFDWLDYLDNAVSGYDNIGAISAWSSCFLSYEEKKASLNKLDIITNTHLWGTVVYRKTWTKIKGFANRYKDKFLSGLPPTIGGREVFDSRAEAIRSFFLHSAREIKVPPSKNFRFPLTDPLEMSYQRDVFLTPNNQPIGFDAMFRLALWIEGLVKVGTLVNHGKNCGEGGLHWGEAIINLLRSQKACPLDVELHTFEVPAGNKPVFTLARLPLDDHHYYDFYGEVRKNGTNDCPERDYPDYVYPNTCNEVLISLLEKHILEKIPLAFTRFGENEIQILKGYPQDSRDTLLKGCCQRWGYKWPEEGPECQGDLVKVFYKVLMETDIFAVWDSKTCPHTGGRPIDKLEKFWLRHSKKDLPIVDLRVVKGRELGDPRKIGKLFHGNPIHIISPHSSLFQARGLDKIIGVPITYTLLAVPFSLRLIKDSYKKMEEEVKAPIILWGGGGGRKDLGIYFRDTCQKICIDMGSTLSCWAGSIPSFPGEERHCCL